MSTKTLTVGQSSGNLNFSTAQKMIHRLLNHERIKTDLNDGKIKGLGSNDNKLAVKAVAFTKEELAEKLGISPGELDKLNLPCFYESILNKISLPLIHLYCATKFAKK